jgi:hypothetical protein
MPNGNTLICSGFTGYFSEIDSASNLVWAYRNPVTGTGLLTQGNPVSSGVNSIFSIKRYGPDYPAFDGRTLTASNPLELNFNLDNCQISTVEENKDKNFSLEIFPNPAEDMIFINNKTSNSTYLIYNLQGIVVRKEYVSEIGNHSIDLSYFLPGTYIIVNSKDPKEASKFTHKD